jgi:hypothetical protein
MDFDFRHIAVPFRMQPGLQRMAPCAAHVTPLHRRSALYAEKQHVHRAGQARLCLPGFDPAPALAAIGAVDGMPELAFEEDFGGAGHRQCHHPVAVRVRAFALGTRGQAGQVSRPRSMHRWPMALRWVQPCPH